MNDVNLSRVKGMGASVREVVPADVKEIISRVRRQRVD
jgi:hypothetical protein